MDMEKVISTLEEIKTQTAEIGLDSAVIAHGFIDKIIALLKEQEAVEPKQVDLYGNDEWWGLVCVCPDCKAEWMSDKADTHFCPKCGQAVKWE